MFLTNVRDFKHWKSLFIILICGVICIVIYLDPTDFKPNIRTANNMNGIANRRYHQLGNLIKKLANLVKFNSESEQARIRRLFKGEIESDYELSIKPLLLHSGIGGLGNQLFQFSTAYCTAVKANRTPVVYIQGRLLHMFPGISVRRFNRTQLKLYKAIYKPQYVGEKHADLFNAKLMGKVLRNNNTFLEGYFESWKYFVDCEEELHSELVFNSTIKKNVDSYMHKLASAAMIKYNIPRKHISFIGIHVRRGDRKKIAAPASFIHNAINYYNTRVKYPLYIVVSDDIKWCKENITITNANLHFSTNKRKNYEEDFVMLASCNYLILTVGTFGWFAAWLSGAETVYYGNWLTDPQIVADHFPFWWKSMV